LRVGRERRRRRWRQRELDQRHQHGQHDQYELVDIHLGDRWRSDDEHGYRLAARAL
jgi:hypothetical protein